MHIKYKQKNSKLLNLPLYSLEILKMRSLDQMNIYTLYIFN